MTKPKVFISSSVEGLDIAHALRRHLAATAEVTTWVEAASLAGRTIIESLAEIADSTDFAVFVVTADDSTADVRFRRLPSPNMLFELGLFAGKIGLPRTFVVVKEPASTSLPTDLNGMMYIALPASNLSNPELAAAPVAAAIRDVIVKNGSYSGRQRSENVYYSCFVSYSWKDTAFAVRLYNDLRSAGVSCWLDEKEMRAGDLISEQVSRAIQLHDKVLLVLSDASIRSSWVRMELRYALQLEHDRKKTVLFPLRLDDSVLEMSGIEEFDQLKQKYIVDFAGWQDETQYRRAFSKLMRDLAINASIEAERLS